MARTIGSWLSGSGPIEPGGETGDRDQPHSAYPGQRLGLPDTGPRSIARMGRRVGALLVDWLIAYGVAALAMVSGLISTAMLSTAVLVIWVIVGSVSVALFGFSPGQLALGLVVVPTDGRVRVGFGRALVRGLLIALVIPPLISDTDLRGLHDRITSTAVLRR